jgi:hypothetical protein
LSNRDFTIQYNAIRHCETIPPQAEGEAISWLGCQPVMGIATSPTAPRNDFLLGKQKSCGRETPAASLNISY